MAEIIIVLAGKKGAGKNTVANLIASTYIGLKQFSVGGLVTSHDGSPVDFSVSKDGQLVQRDSAKKLDKIVSLEHNIGDEEFIGNSDVRIISFATPLKQFCRDVLGLTKEQCYGTDAQKNTRTRLQWDFLPLWIRFKNRAKWWHMPRSGYMTARQVMQVFGTDMIRSWCKDGWARAGYELALRCKESIVIISDGRFPNEIEEGHQRRQDMCEVYTVRCNRAPFKDNHPSEREIDSVPRHMFDMWLPADLTFDQQAQYVTQTFGKLFSDWGLI